MDKPKLLLIDDNEAFLELFTTLPETDGFDIITLTSGVKALEILAQETVDLVISDIEMPEMSGLELFNELQEKHPQIPVIMITAFGSTEEAVQAVRKGAFHYFEKLLNDKLPLFWTAVREAVAKGKMLREIELLRKQSRWGEKSATNIIGESTAMQEVKTSIQTVAAMPATVLITGETGTGKDLVARSIHEQSPRKASPFFAFACGEFATGVLESELFGHERGAFTGAVELRKGLFELANQGTVFMDEVSDAPAELQAKLLRVLESGSFTRVGGNTSVSSDFRVIAATNHNLEKDVESGRFRKDLFYRINVYEIKLPPLRHRREDIPLLAEFYLKRLSMDYGRSIDRFSGDALASLCEYDWPGNVRELINVIERAVIICSDPIVTTRHLPFSTRTERELSGLNLKEMEKLYIRLALDQTNGNKTKAAEILGISRKTLIEKVKRL